ncbi:HTH-type transcriptional repressor PurR [Streptomyces californicus]
MPVRALQDVADAAGVSVGTVSNVLNHPAKVSPATAERVREAISRLGFVRNDAARELVSGSTKSIGMVLADIENSLFIDMAHGAQDAARAVGQNLLLANTACDMKLQDDYLDLFDESRVTGVLLAPMEDSTAGIALIPLARPPSRAAQLCPAAGHLLLGAGQQRARGLPGGPPSHRHRAHPAGVRGRARRLPARARPAQGSACGGCRGGSRRHPGGDTASA